MRITVEQLLLEMKKTTSSLLELDIENEANHGLLFSLQNKQIELRETIENIVGNEAYIYNEQEKQLLSDCMASELRISEKVQKLYADAGEQLQQITSSKRSRNAYQGDTIQHIGYFIDSHK